MNGSAIVYTTQFVTRLMREHGAARHHVMRPPVLLMASRVYSSTLSSTQAIAVVQNFQQRVVGSIERRLSLLKRRSSRKKVQLVLLLATLLLHLVNARMPRQVWSYSRSTTWWEQVACNTFTQRDWMENFRVSRETFLYICDQLKCIIGKHDTRFRRAISVQKRVAITLWILATPCEYRSVAHLFGLARCTVCCVVKETCRAIVMRLLPKYIRFPVGDKLKETAQGFYDRWGIPQCAGSIDGSHIPVRPPSLNHTDYYNRKGWYSVVVQAVVDHNYLFTDLYIGWPGSVHDARVLANSGIYHKCNNKELLVGDELHLTNHTIPVFLVGDSAYPLLPWLIKPFAMSGTLTAQQKTFNYRICRGRVVVEIAFGRLKARWRRLLKQNDMHVKNVPHVVAACCTLHNICEIHGDTFNDEWLTEDTSLADQEAAPSTSNTDSGNDVRDALVEYFSHNSL